MFRGWRVVVCPQVDHSYSWGADTITVTAHLGGNVVGLTVNAYDANIEYTSGLFIPSQTSSTLAQLADSHWPDSAREVSGVGADGVSLVLLRGKVLSSAPVHFTLEKGSADAPLGSLWAVDDQSLTDTTSAGGARDRLDAGGSVDEGPTDLSVSPVSLNGEQWVFAVYRAPRNFDDAGGATAGLRERTIKIHASVPASGSAAGSEQTIDMTVARPLVLFMHGTWDKPAAWDNFPLYANSATALNDYQSGSEPFYADRLDFASLKHAAGPVLQNAGYVLPQVIDKLRRWREKIGVAATQADVVTHSYGGPTMRYVAGRHAAAGGRPVRDGVAVRPPRRSLPESRRTELVADDLGLPGAPETHELQLQPALRCRRRRLG